MTLQTNDEDNSVELSFALAKKINFACHQNSYSVLRELRLKNASETEALSNISVHLNSDPVFLKPKVWHVDKIEAGGIVPIRNRDIDLVGQYLAGLSESVTGSVSFRVLKDESIIGEWSESVELLAPNEWGGAGFMPELLAAFCLPNDPAIDRVIHAASNILRRAGKPYAIEGYKSGSRQRVWEIASAIYAAVANLGLSYSTPPASFETNGQKVRLPSQILEGRVATCLDTALLLAAAFEQAGLNPIIALLKEHALVGVWLQPEKLASVTNDEAEVVRKRCQLNELVLVESTLVTSQPAPPFSRAVQRAMDHLHPDSDTDFVTAVDIARARAHQISPLGFRSKKDGLVGEGDEAADVQLPLEEAPPLPDFDEEPEEEKPETPAGRIERWHRKLLDLSARNPMLNHRSTKSSLAIYCPDPGALEDKLAAGARISVAPVPQARFEEQDRDLHSQRTGELIDEKYAQDALDQNQVLVHLTKEELDKRLVEIYRRAQTSLQEGGANTLYLAIGFLLWKRDEKDDRRFRAPLILLPMSLQRQSVRSGVKMMAHDDEPRFNTTLLEMLRKDFGINIHGFDGALPEDASGVDVSGVWERVRRKVKDSPGFEVVEDVVLGHFSFAKYLMWKDLVDRTDDLRQNPVVRHLIDTPRDSYDSNISFVDRDEIDREFKPSDFLAPLPADSSQMAVIASADRGKDFIVIGPPGTGKSQTISNLIAHLLGKGKTVLFVSEKTAALDVVYRRLDEIGLGRFCLELHSNKARKTDVLNQLKEAWNSGFARTAEAWEEEARAVQVYRDRLNGYVDRLHRKHPNGMTPHFALGVKIRDEVLAQRVQFSWSSANTHSKGDLDRIREAVRLLQVQARAVGDISESPFRIISHGDWSPTWEREILTSSIKLSNAAQQASSTCEALCSAIGIHLPDKTLRRLESFRAFSDVLKKAFRRQTAFALEAEGQERIEALEKSVSHLKSYAAAQAKLSCPYDPMAWRRLDGEGLQIRWKESQDFWFLKRFLAQRKIKKEMQAGGAKGTPDPETDAQVLIEIRRQGEAIDALDLQLKALRAWNGHDSDPIRIDEIRALAQEIRAAVSRLADTPQALIEIRAKVMALIGNGNAFLAPDAPVGMAADDFLRSFQNLSEAVVDFDLHAGKPLRDSLSQGGYSIEELQATADSIAEHHADLNHWCGWQRRRNEALDLDLGPLVEGVEAGRVPIEEIPETFDAAYCTWWSERVLEDDDILRQFSSAEHEDAINKFRELDSKFQKTTARYIEARLSAGLPGESDVPQSSQWGLIKREITKRAKHKPVRRLLEEAPDAITRLAPCLMMSPLSVAQYLPSDQSLFDVVIFDEASQITVWDAVGSIARGKQVIVAGDPKQMPPTNFFSRSDDDADGDIDYDGDLESILDELRSSNVPELTLNLHYRSRRESLIAFSNDRYYDNGLVTFPAPERSDRGLRLVQPDGFYDRGKSRTNEGEARAIVSEIIGRLNSNDPEISQKSIGVVSFNSEQQSLVQDLLDRERSKNPGIEWAFSENATEPVFVKNLETVQGDERDVILFSVTYGPDRAGNVYMNFGPLNRDGGERRMNVAMTRARSEMVVFSTMHPDKIDLSRTGARAVADLKHFLEYAERGPEALAAQVHGSLGDFESPFESAVAAGLRERGWTVHPQIGVSAFRVDLGIVHPDRSGVYLAGVECDGAMYHSSAYARERDKIRQSVLEGLGWKLFRVWSTDWWINKARALDHLDAQLGDHLEIARAAEEETDSDSEAVDLVSEESTTESEDLEKRAQSVEERTLADTNEPTFRKVASFGGGAVARQDREDDSNRAANPEVAPRERPSAVATNEEFRRTSKYVQADVKVDSGGEALGEMKPSELVDVIVEIVEIESPVHVDDVIRRVTHGAGLQRAGARIQNVVKSAISVAVRRQSVRKKRNFLWRLDQKKAEVRDRQDLAPQDKKLDRVAPEEIAMSLIDVVRRNFSLSENDAISESASDLGFHRVTAGMNKQFQRVLGALVAKDILKREDGTISSS
jgi:very-short-patch-repair endonuclease/DNA polymerase III delta prime subunit